MNHTTVNDDWVPLKPTYHLPRDVAVLCILGQLDPKWCRVRNFNFPKDSGDYCSPQENGRLFSRLQREGLVERRIHPQERIVQYRLTEPGRKAYHSLKHLLDEE